MADELGIFSMAIWTVKEGMEEEFIDAWTSFARWTSDEQMGAMGAYLTRERSNPLAFVSFGPWESDDWLLRWRGTAEFKEFFSRAKELCSDVSPMTLDTVTAVGMPRLLAGQQ